MNSFWKEMYETRDAIADFYEKKVKDIMQTARSEIPRITDDADVAKVIDLLNTWDHVWVMDTAEPTQLVGVITYSDTIALLSPPLTSDQPFDNPDPRSLQFGVGLTAAAIMSKKPATASAEESIRDILVKMKEQKIKHLPVVDAYGQLIGEISLGHLIKDYSKQYFETTKTTEKTLQ